MKKCPFCAEEIQDEAIKCRFCGESLKKKKWRNCLLGCLTVFVGSILVFVAAISLSLLVIKLIVQRVFFGTPKPLPHYYPPFTGQGLEGILREFGEIFRALWLRLMDFIHYVFRGQRLTF